MKMTNNSGKPPFFMKKINGKYQAVPYGILDSESQPQNVVKRKKTARNIMRDKLSWADYKTSAEVMEIARYAVEARALPAKAQLHPAPGSTIPACSMPDPQGVHHIVAPVWSQYNLKVDDYDKWLLYRGSLWHEARHAADTPKGLWHKLRNPTVGEQYYCPKCGHDHYVDSGIGQRHLKYVSDDKVIGVGPSTARKLINIVEDERIEQRGMLRQEGMRETYLKRSAYYSYIRPSMEEIAKLEYADPVKAQLVEAFQQRLRLGKIKGKMLKKEYRERVENAAQIIEAEIERINKEYPEKDEGITEEVINLVNTAIKELKLDSEPTIPGKERFNPRPPPEFDQKQVDQAKSRCKGYDPQKEKELEQKKREANQKANKEHQEYSKAASEWINKRRELNQKKERQETIEKAEKAIEEAKKRAEREMEQFKRDMEQAEKQAQQATDEGTENFWKNEKEKYRERYENAKENKERIERDIDKLEKHREKTEKELEQAKEEAKKANQKLSKEKGEWDEAQKEDIDRGEELENFKREVREAAEKHLEEEWNEKEQQRVEEWEQELQNDDYDPDDYSDLEPGDTDQETKAARNIEWRASADDSEVPSMSPDETWKSGKGDQDDDIEGEMEKYLKSLKSDAKKAGRTEREDSGEDDPLEVYEEDVDNAMKGTDAQARAEYEQIKSGKQKDVGLQAYAPVMKGESIAPYADPVFKREMHKQLREWETGKAKTYSEDTGRLSPRAARRSRGKVPFVNKQRKSVKGQKYLFVVDFSGSMKEREEAYKKALLNTFETLNRIKAKQAVVAFGVANQGNLGTVKGDFKVKSFEDGKWSNTHAQQLAALKADLYNTPLSRNYEQLREYVKRHKPDKIITVTDGSPNGATNPYEATKNAMKELKRLSRRTEQVAFGIAKDKKSENNMEENFRQLEYDKTFTERELRKLPERIVNLIAPED